MLSASGNEVKGKVRRYNKILRLPNGTKTAAFRMLVLVAAAATPSCHIDAVDVFAQIARYANDHKLQRFIACVLEGMDFSQLDRYRVPFVYGRRLGSAAPSADCDSSV